MIVYAVYAITNPGSDGVVFAAVLAAIAGVLGYTVASVKAKVKK